MSDGASEAFSRYLSQIERGGNADFEAFCRDHGEIADALRARYRAWKEGTRVRESPSRPTQAEGVFFEDKPIEANESAIRHRLEALASRRTAEARYSSQGEVARGGMGIVHKVFDHDLRRTLAMKVLLARPDASGHAPIAAIGRFLEEAQITGQLDHPGVIPVHEIGVDSEGRAFFTMRMVRGRTLDEIFRLARAGAEGWTLPRAVGVVMKVCETMAYAHSKGVIHRDLKPSNVMVGKFGETYVMDWGLAKVKGPGKPQESRIETDSGLSMTHVRTDRGEEVLRTPGSPLLTVQGAVIGTPYFMPPEQAAGRLHEVDHRSDVYSVGTLLYSLLAGKPPYADAEATPVVVLQALLDGPPPAIQDLDATAPHELCAICEKAMAREPAARYADMLAMSDDLRAWLEGRVVRAYEQGAFAQFRKWVRRNRALAGSIFLALMIVLLGSFAFAWQQRRQVRDLSRANRETLVARDEAREKEKIALQNEDKARRRSYASNIAAADAGLRMNESQEALRWLDACDVALRGFEWRHLRMKCDASAARIDGHGGRVQAVVWTPDGGRLVSGSDDRTVRVFDAEGGRELFVLQGCSDAVTSVAVSSDGTLIAAGCADNLVRLWDARSGRPAQAMAGHDAKVSCVAFRPDGARLATGSTDGAVRLWDAPEWRSRPPIEGDPVHAIAFSPDGRRIAADREGRIEVLDAESGAVVLSIEGHDGWVEALAFSPDGGVLASGGQDGAVRIWDAATGARRFAIERPGDQIYSLAFSPDGSLLATASNDKTVRLFDAATGRPLRILLGHEEAVRGVAFSPNAPRIASASSDGSIRLWDQAEGGAMAIRRCGGSFVNAIAVGRDGTTIAAASADEGSIRLFDAKKPEVSLSVGENLGGVNAVALSADGEYLATGGEEDSSIRIFRARTALLERSLLGHDESVTSVAFSPDGARILSGSADATVRLWDRASGEERKALRGHEAGVTCVVFDADGSRAASGSADGTARLWDLATGECLRVFRGHGGPVLSVAFDPKWPRLATASADGTVRLWEIGGDEHAKTLHGGTAAVASVAFSPDGGRVVGGCRDKSLRVWDAEKGELLLSLRGHEGWVTSVAFAAGGKALVSAGFDGTVRIWKAE